MADESLKKKIQDLLKAGFFSSPEDLVNVLDGDGAEDDIPVVIVTRKFDGRRYSEQQELVSGDLIAQLDPGEWGKVSLSIGVSPEEIKAF